MNPEMSLVEASVPVLPENYRPSPIRRVVMWVWALTSSIALLFMIVAAVVGWNALETVSASLLPFAGEAGCSAYWTFILHAKEAGLDARGVATMYSELNAEGGTPVASVCGTVGEVYARLP
ncbi:hypothetical protein [Microbacterium sp. NPDC087592]|uniref:hypothetical protein n=1 Tax=Microbacterium sp. NPDC087592 TaxID=3364193 RepID=UPI0038177C8F